jgi:hypothetical protein
MSVVVSRYLDHKRILDNRIVERRNQVIAKSGGWFFTYLHMVLTGKPVPNMVIENARQDVVDLWLDALHEDNRRSPSSRGLKILRLKAVQLIAEIGQSADRFFEAMIETAGDSMESEIGALLRPEWLSEIEAA